MRDLRRTRWITTAAQYCAALPQALYIMSKFTQYVWNQNVAAVLASRQEIGSAQVLDIQQAWKSEYDKAEELGELAPRSLEHLFYALFTWSRATMQRCIPLFWMF